MNPGEKAKHIIDKFLPLVESFTEVGRLENAKKCASIAVDEMIDYLISNKITGTLMAYWQQVKQEIENYETNI